MNVNYKIGDKVKIIGNSNGSINEIGDIGTIVEWISHQRNSRDNYNLWRVNVDGRSNMNNITRDYDMKLYYDNTAKLLDSETAQSATGEIFKVGDVVKLEHSNDLVTITALNHGNGINHNNIYASLETKTYQININNISLHIDKFKLPERYCVKHHDKVAKYITNVVHTPGTYYEDLNLYSHFPVFNRGTHCSMNMQPGYTEITYEQFKKYVLNE